MEAIKDAIVKITRANHRVSVRQVFYQLASSGVVGKTEHQYRAVMRLVDMLRIEGRIPFDAIADNTRWPLRPAAYSNAEDALADLVETYRRSRWENQSAYVEIWLEKDALSGVFYEITAAYDVPLMVTRGYSSTTFLHDAAQTIARQGKPAFLYCFGDYDPSGVDITRDVESRIKRFAPEAEVEVERIALTAAQIRDRNLPDRPTKGRDARAKEWDGGSVELDALPSEILWQLIEACVTKHIDRQLWEETERQEQEDRTRLTALIDHLAASDGLNSEGQ